MSLVAEKLKVIQLGRSEYARTAASMRAFTLARNQATPDELWLAEHDPVYTLGQGAADATVPNGIPVVRSDRGGEITYHGPGQVMFYALIVLARRGIKVKRFVWLLEQAAIDLLDAHSVRGERRAGAPGVYVGGAKIAALGVRVARGRSYHGLALNVDMDLSPFLAIDPCGYPGLAVTDLKSIGIRISSEQAAQTLGATFLALLENA